MNAPADSAPAPASRPRLSLRWRLALTYAGIALLSVGVLGLVLVGVLNDYFARSEDRYLRAAADQVAQGVAHSGNLGRDIAIAALATQTRVRLYDDKGQLLADSGSPAEIDPGNIGRPGGGMMGGMRGRLPAPLGSGFFGDNPQQRSQRSLSYPLVDATGAQVGRIVISDGPASGRDVLASVVQGLVLAAIVAMGLATGVGYAISARIARPVAALTDASDRMADGDLTARAPVTGSDEVGRLGASFNGMAERMETTVTTLRRFVADAAHEIGTPLTALRADLDIAADVATSDDERRLLDRAQVQAQRLEDLSTNLLRLSRLEAGEAAVGDETADAVAVARTAVDAAASRAEQAGITLAAITPAESVRVALDEPRLGTIVGNLVDNALKFTPEGGTVTVGVEAGEGSALITVTDTGIGIPEAEQEAVFERFFRARNTASYQGSGLGLAIVAATVRAAGGEITFASSDEGTRFEVRLPAPA
jgi:signal transduction histidine kinase